MWTVDFEEILAEVRPVLVDPTTRLVHDSYYCPAVAGPQPALALEPTDFDDVYRRRLRACSWCCRG